MDNTTSIDEHGRSESQWRTFSDCFYFLSEEGSKPICWEWGRSKRWERFEERGEGIRRKHGRVTRWGKSVRLQGWDEWYECKVRTDSLAVKLSATMLSWVGACTEIWLWSEPGFCQMSMTKKREAKEMRVYMKEWVYDRPRTIGWVNRNGRKYEDSMVNCYRSWWWQRV